MNPDEAGTCRAQSQRRDICLACNSPALGETVRGLLDSYVSLRVVPDLHTAREVPAGSTALLVDAACIPEADFRPFIRRLRALHATGHYLPTLLVTTSRTPVSPRGAFMSGITGMLKHPVDHGSLNAGLERLVNTSRWWRELEEDPFLKRETTICISLMRRDKHQDSISRDPISSRISAEAFLDFVSLLARDFLIGDEQAGRLKSRHPAALYETAAEYDIPRSHVLRKISDFTRFRRVTHIVPETMIAGILPPEFCKRHLVLPLQLSSDSPSLVFGNPFDYELVLALRKLNLIPDSNHMLVADPVTILFALSSRPGRSAGTFPTAEQKECVVQRTAASKLDVQNLGTYLLESAVRMRASDIHIEPKCSMHLVRFRVDGDLYDILCLDDNGHRLVSRFKLLGKIDIAEQRKPQDGSFDTIILNKRFSLRIATSPTPDGEGINIRLLETDSALLTLIELGMNTRQEKSIINLANRRNGMILFVGPTGSGKTTTIYSLLAHVDCENRCLVSVEDPIEYHIPQAIQHNVNPKAGVTFESLLKASVRQDPDILFIGEIRDPVSAQIAMDFTSTGHFTLSSLHTVNAATAVFRLERLGISRDVMAECILAVVAQRLVKRLCPECKEAGEVHADEYRMMQRFVGTPPEVVARPRGCEYCNHTGYFGRTGVFEVIHFTPHIQEMLLANRPIAEIRHELEKQGEFLVSHHAIEKVSQLVCSPKDIIEAVLLEELTVETGDDAPDICPLPHRVDQTETGGSRSVRLLIIDDDPDILDLLHTYLGRHGFQCDRASDGIDALLKLGNCRYDLIISDIMMPNLDGFRMLEMLKLKGIDVPLVFMTAFTSVENENQARELGAEEFIRKPLDLGMVVRVVNRILAHQSSNGRP